MEGYSVTEAASILGVPTERVWELLARGVLAGAPEGETGMRVYLQPRPAPAPPVVEPVRPNGDDGPAEPARELSPFRELLTEFRNLTERYGQALLALGEARGEVAALRSRVDLLEARMDLRLPAAAPAPMTPSAPWPPPMPSATVPHAAPQRDAEQAVADEDDRSVPRRRSHRRATESFAEALARAEDPTPAELPGAHEAAAALAALREEAEMEAAPAEAVLPRELPPAEPMPAADEPMPAADEPVAAADEPVAAADERVAAIEEPAPAPEPEPMTAAEARPAEPALELALAPEPDVAEEAVDEHPAVEAAAAVPDDAAAPPEPVAATEEPVAEVEPIDWDPSRYTVEIAEPDWYAEEREASFAATAPVPAPAVEAVPETAAEIHDETRIETEADVEAEETMLWFGRAPEPAGPQDEDAADEIETAGAVRRIEADESLPGSSELDDALAALDALARGSTPDAPAAPEPEAPPDEEWPPAPGTASTLPDTVDEERADPTAGSLTSLTRPVPTPASRAYRRLRRIFPG